MTLWKGKLWCQTYGQNTMYMTRCADPRFAYIKCYLVNRVEHFEAVVGGCFLISIYLNTSKVMSHVMSIQVHNSRNRDNRLTYLKCERHWHLRNVIQIISRSPMCKVPSKWWNKKALVHFLRWRLSIITLLDSHNLSNLWDVTYPTAPPPDPTRQLSWKLRWFKFSKTDLIKWEGAPSGVVFLWSYGINNACSWTEEWENV